MARFLFVTEPRAEGGGGGGRSEPSHDCQLATQLRQSAPLQLLACRLLHLNSAAACDFRLDFPLDDSTHTVLWAALGDRSVAWEVGHAATVVPAGCLPCRWKGGLSHPTRRERDQETLSVGFRPSFKRDCLIIDLIQFPLLVHL